MDFRISPELDALRLRTRAFVERDVIPREAEALDGDALDWKVVEDLRAKARAAGLWAPHLPREWGGLGLSAVGLALVAQELGASVLAPYAVNAMAPDEGNMMTLLRFGSEAQKERWLRPLAEGRIRSCFAMTEPDAGADPRRLRATARREGDAWRLDGRKTFITGASGAAFAIVVANAEGVAPTDGHPSSANADGAGPTLFLVDGKDPGFRVAREIPTMGTHAPGGHCEVGLAGARGEPLGEVGKGFEHAQDRLGHGRIAHAMRWLGAAQRALDLAAARSLAREAFGGPLAEKQGVQWMIAESAIDLHAARLMVLHAAARIDAGQEHRNEVAMAKVFVAGALHRVVDRAIQVHGALGYSEDLPLERFYRDARAARIYDGPDEVHLMTIARAALRAQKESGSTRAATGGV